VPSPLLDPEDVRAWQLHVRDVRRVSWSTYNVDTCALRFFYAIVLHRADRIADILYGRRPVHLPAVLAQEEAQRIFASLRIERDRVLLATTYACGLRVNETTHLQAGTSTARG